MTRAGRGRPCGGARLAALLTTVALALGACGYGFQGSLPSHVKTVAVPIFVNRTQEPAVESTITAAVVDAFSSTGRLKVVPLAEADSILEGEIVGYALQALAYDRQLNIQEYRLVVTLNVRFRDVRRGGFLWQQDGLQEKGDFRVVGQAGTASATIGREEGAVREAAAVIGRRIALLAVDRF
jgi:hypothetical protein